MNDAFVFVCHASVTPERACSIKYLCPPTLFCLADCHLLSTYDAQTAEPHCSWIWSNKRSWPEELVISQHPISIPCLFSTE